jgi:hypothetical protein
MFGIVAGMMAPALANAIAPCSLHVVTFTLKWRFCSSEQVYIVIAHLLPGAHRYDPEDKCVTLCCAAGMVSTTHTKVEKVPAVHFRTPLSHSTWLRNVRLPSFPHRSPWRPHWCCSWRKRGARSPRIMNRLSEFPTQCLLPPAPAAGTTTTGSPCRIVPAGTCWLATTSLRPVQKKIRQPKTRTNKYMTTV